MASGQVLPVTDFSNIASLPRHKFDNYISRKGFVSAGAQQQNDMVVYNYFFKGKKKDANDSSKRFISKSFQNNTFSFTYQTSSMKEAMDIRYGLRMADFFCSEKNDTINNSSVLFQKRDITVRLMTHMEDSVINYSFFVNKKVLPGPKSIIYAEDLLTFESHENLVSVFGTDNVKKDIYYFSENQVNKCSVLFPNTDRQVIYIWEDEENNCTVSYLLIGGNLRVKSAFGFNESVGQNIWTLRNGVRTGMSLQELKMINGGDFKFYGVNSEFAGMILPENKGNIDFKKNGIMLNCLNCNDAKFMGTDIVTASNAIYESRRLYVSTIILVPLKETL